MRNLSFITIIVVTIVIGQRSYQGQDGEYKRSSIQHDTLIRAEKRPDLVAEYNHVAMFKLASRKSSYHVGEMISVDMAMLNTADMPIFFFSLLQPNIYVRHKAEKEINIIPYAIREFAPTSELYELLQSKDITTKSFQLLAGCDKAASRQLSRRLDDRTSKNEFEQNLFVNWGQACLKITHPGSYTIIAEQSNYDVVVTNDKSDLKTAVGTIRSTPLTITIIK